MVFNTNAGLKMVVLPTDMYANHKHSDATGDYMNSGFIFMPAFGQDMDIEAADVLKERFAGNEIVPVRSDGLAKEGRGLNCISWNVLE